MAELRQEVKRNRQLIHPNILRVYDLVEDSGWAAISMDAFEGESLAARLAQKNGTGLDPQETHSWIGQLCQTLEDAHKINVLHRDISPGNLFVIGDGKLLVTNFGLSRCLADAGARISGKENARLAARSPQELDGAVSTRADDVYAVGALLFQVLTGRLPFVDADFPGQIRNAAPPAVSSLRGASAPQVLASWEKVIAACLEKTPEARPPSLLEVAKQLTLASEKGAAAPAPVLIAEKKATSLQSPAAEPKPVSKATTSGPKLAAKTMSESPKKLEPAAPVLRKLTPDVYSSVVPERSRIPALGFAVAVGLIAIGAVGYYFNGPGEGSRNAEPTSELTPTEPPAGLELRSVNNKIDEPVIPAIAEPTEAAAEPALPSPVEVLKPELAVAEPAPDLVASPASTASPVLLAAAATPPPVKTTVAVVPPSVMTDEEKAVAEKTAALEKAKKIALGAEKAREDMARQQRQAEAAVVEAQKALEQKAKALAPVKKAADDVLTQRKKLDEEQKAADLAAEQARQLAAEKVRAAETAKKAIADLEAKNQEKLAAQEKAAAEMQALEKSLADKQQVVAGVVKSARELEAERARNQAEIKQSEQEVEQAKTLAVEARRLREEAEAERRKLGQELAEMQKLMEKKKAEIEGRLKKLENLGAKPTVVTPAPEAASAPEVKPVEKPATPMPLIKPTSAITPPPVVPVPAPIAVLPKPATPSPAPATAAAVDGEPKSTPATPLQLAMKTEPEKLALVTPAVPKASTPGSGTENSLAMKFARVGDVDFCIWQTRVKDFEVFAKAVNLKSTAWRGPGFKQGPDHPVVNVTWVEAVAFCKWLTELEHKDGTLPAAQFYRLPTDLEWSKAVGLPDESGKTPEVRDMGISDVFPWGIQWPPPPNSGNYTGEETGSDVAIKGYDDGFAWTSPVGSFPPNKLGLYDMGGNVWQWCMDAWNTDSKAKVLRGASWYNGALKLSLLSSCRVHALPESSTDNYGFRIVRTSDSAKPDRR